MAKRMVLAVALMLLLQPTASDTLGARAGDLHPEREALPRLFREEQPIASESPEDQVFASESPEDPSRDGGRATEALLEEGEESAEAASEAAKEAASAKASFLETLDARGDSHKSLAEVDEEGGRRCCCKEDKDSKSFAWCGWKTPIKKFIFFGAACPDPYSDRPDSSCQGQTITFAKAGKPDVDIAYTFAFELSPLGFKCDPKLPLVVTELEEAMSLGVEVGMEVKAINGVELPTDFVSADKMFLKFLKFVKSLPKVCGSIQCPPDAVCCKVLLLESCQATSRSCR